MPFLEPVTPEMLANSPYFLAWAKELGYSPEDVFDFTVAVFPNEDGTVKDECEAGITFKDGKYFTHTEKWSEGKLGPKPEV
jgi:hypothetical protein